MKRLSPVHAAGLHIKNQIDTYRRVFDSDAFPASSPPRAILSLQGLRDGQTVDLSVEGLGLGTSGIILSLLGAGGDADKRRETKAIGKDPCCGRKIQCYQIHTQVS